MYFTISLFFQELILETIIMSSCNIFQLNGASDGFCNGGGVNSRLGFLALKKNFFLLHITKSLVTSVTYFTIKTIYKDMTYNVSNI